MAAIKEITLSAKGQIVIPAERREDVLTRLEGKCHAGTLAA
jgi:bifunctional DNA-binding transcriptional regulator/antitoxin component of YhaV-PrlF toxin-antitoxin module